MPNAIANNKFENIPAESRPEVECLIRLPLASDLWLRAFASALRLLPRFQFPPEEVILKNATKQSV